MAGKLKITCRVVVGTDFEEAVSEARRISRILDAWVEFDFNGISVSVHPKTSITVAVEQFHEAIEKQVNFIIT